MLNITGNKFAKKKGTIPTNLNIIITKSSFFWNIKFKFLNFVNKFSFKKSYKKYFAKMYRHKAPIDNAVVTIIVPIHFPKINPPINAIGLPKPRSTTHKTVSRKKIEINKIKLFSFNILSRS